jgi:hypothetical protein
MCSAVRINRWFMMPQNMMPELAKAELTIPMWHPSATTGHRADVECAAGALVAVPPPVLTYVQIWRRRLQNTHRRWQSGSGYHAR